MGGGEGLGVGWQCFWRIEAAMELPSWRRGDGRLNLAIFGWDI